MSWLSILTISGFLLTGISPLLMGVTPISVAWWAYQASISPILFCAFCRLTALSASCWGTEFPEPVLPSADLPPDSTSEVAATCLEKVSIMS